MNRFLSALCLIALAVPVAAQTPAAPTITPLFSFPCDSTLSQCPDGSFLAGFLESADGNFYGIASEGGTGMNSQGSIFKITPSGKFTLLYSFAELPDGSLPSGASPTSLMEGWTEISTGLPSWMAATVWELLSD